MKAGGDNRASPPSGGYRLLEHTADMGIEAWGGSEAALFLQAAHGLKEMIFGSLPEEGERREKVEIAGEDSAELLVNWLNEIIFLFETRSLVPSAFSIESLEGGRLRAAIRGADFDPSLHHVEREVKSATFHQLQVQRTPEGWRTVIYVDL